jgi:hypothetical protein
MLSMVDDGMSPECADLSAAPGGAEHGRAAVGHGGQRDRAADRATTHRAVARALAAEEAGDGASAF